jgi:tRNA(Ile)-lysidine synthase
MQLAPEVLIRSLTAALPPAWNGAVLVAFSGGLDSTVLLHALAHAQLPIRAVHVDHGLHAQSGAWVEHCQRVAESLGIELVTRRVTVDARAELGLEAAAREVRYDALRDLLQEGEALVTAHHADDQLETMLLAVMRGAGVRGLAAMPACRPFGRGWHARPLLEYTRAELEIWASAAGLECLEDPSNADNALDRNFLRHRIVTALRERWPSAAHSARRTAAHLGEASDVLDALGQADLATARVGECLDVGALSALDPTRRRNLLRCWLRGRGARAPSTRKLAAIDHDMLNAQEDRSPCIEWDGFEVRRHRGLLYAAPCIVPLDPAHHDLTWDGRAPLTLPAALGALRVEHTPGSGLDAAIMSRGLHVRFRAGGEEIRPTGDAHHRKLRKLLQSADILPWWRDRLPLMYVEERLACVGDLWIAQEFAASDARDGVAIVWEGKPTMTVTRRA